MIRDNKLAVLKAWFQSKEQAPITWIGAFTHTGFLPVARRRTTDAVQFCNSGEGGPLHRSRIGACCGLRLSARMISVYDPIGPLTQTQTPTL